MNRDDEDRIDSSDHLTGGYGGDPEYADEPEQSRGSAGDADFGTTPGGSSRTAEETDGGEAGPEGRE